MKIEQFAVIGHPIGHTMSPFIHRRLFALSGYSPRYEVLDIPDLAQGLKKLKSFDGVNITIPHKQGILPFLADIDEKAKRFGSVNTLKIQEGRLTGYTTDGQGCLRALASGGADTSRVLLLGCGGAARAIAFSLKDAGAAVDLCVRNLEKGRALMGELGGVGRVRTFSETEAGSAAYSLLINATNVGMYPNGHESPVTLKVAARCESIFDAVYNPHETALLRLGKEAEKNLIFGMDMLVFQAVEAHSIWYGGVFRQADLRALCDDAAAECARKFAGM